MYLNSFGRNPAPPILPQQKRGRNKQSGFWMIFSFIIYKHCIMQAVLGRHAVSTAMVYNDTPQEQLHQAGPMFVCFAGFKRKCLALRPKHPLVACERSWTRSKRTWKLMKNFERTGRRLGDFIQFFCTFSR